MAESSFQQPTSEQLATFVQGDPIAIDEVAHLLLPQLHRWAIRQYSNVSSDEVQSTVNAAFAEACRNHSRYDPEQATLTTYIIKLIQWRMAEAIKKIVKLEDFIQERQENESQEPYNQLSASDIDSRIMQERFFGEVMDRLDGAEKEFLTLMFEEEKSQDSYSAILTRYGAVENSVAEVKNFKERLKRKIKAIAHELGYESDDLLF